MNNLSSETHSIYLGSLKTNLKPSQILFHNPPHLPPGDSESSVYLCSAFISSKDALYELVIREMCRGRKNISIKHTKFQQM